MVNLYSTVLDFICRAKRHRDSSRLSELIQWIEDYGCADRELERVLNLTSQLSIQESVTQMEAAEQKVSALKSLVDSERVEDIHDGISTMLLTTTSTAEDVENIRKRLEATLAGLERPLIRITDQVSDLYGALKSTLLMQEKHGTPRLIMTRKQEKRASIVDFPCRRPTTLQGGIGICYIWVRRVALSRSMLHDLERLEQFGNILAIWHAGVRKDKTCSPNEPTPQDIMRSLVKQISLTREENDCRVRCPLLKVYKSRQAEASHTGERPAPLTVEDCVEVICEIGRATPLTIVIDALDECSSQERRILLEALEEIRQRCRDVVKIFVSSRYEEDIAVAFKKGETLEVTFQSNHEDLKQFVEIEVERFVKRWSTMHGESDLALHKLGEDIKEALMTGAQGMFLWVTLQLESISDTDHVKDIDSIRQALTSLPPTLSKSYEAIYRRINSMSESTRRVAISSFQWLLCAKRKLSVSELVAAISMFSTQSSHVSARSIRDYCCNLVTIDNEADTFRLVHLTVREFLETLPEFSIDESNATIVDGCLGLYLREERESNILSYATWYWPAHLEQLSGSPQREMIKPALLEFSTEEEHFEDWLDDLDTLNIENNPSWSNSLHRKLTASFASPPSALFMMSCFGLEEVLESSELARAMDLNQRNKHNTSALYLSARWGHIAMTQRLLDLGAAVDAPGSQHGTALQAASFAGHGEIVKILLERGASFSPAGTSQAEKVEYSSPLQAALANGHDGVAQFCSLWGKSRQARRLIQEYGNGRINEENGYFGNALAAAIASRKVGLVQLVIDAGANIDARGRFGSPLRAAVISGHLEIARYLLKKKANPNTEDKKLGDPLQAAASLGNVDMMLMLLDHGARADGFGGHFGNTLQAASFNGHEQCVRLLIERGAALDFKHNYMPVRYRDALQAAVYAGHENIVNVLFAAGAKLNRERHEYNPFCSLSCRSKRIALPGLRTGTGRLDIPAWLGPLEVAARKGNVILVRMLLAKGARIDAMDASSEDNEYHWGCAYTALQIAAFWGHLPVVELLLDHGADLDAQRQTLGTPLQAALEGGHFDVAEVLLSRGAEIDRHWGMFGSCLQVHSERGNFRVVEFLLDHGANIEDSGGENGNALQVACDAGHIDIVRFLLGRHADVRASGKDLGNALQAASYKGHLDIVKLLLRQGIEVDETDGDTETALCLAAGNGHEKTVIFLLQQGANVDGYSTFLNKHIKPREQQSIVAVPLHLAAVGGHEATVSILLENGANAHLEGTYRLNSSFTSDESDFSEFKSTPMFAACFWGHASIAKRLFQEDPWSYLSHDVYMSIVKTSLSRGKKEIATMLVQEAILAGFKVEHFEGPFRYACVKGCTEILKQILEHFVLENWPAAILLAAEEGRGAVVEVLLQNGADVDIRDEHGNLALDLAIKGIKKYKYHYWPSNPPSWTEVIMVLLCAGAKTNDFSGKIREIFPVIVKRGRVDILRTLDRCGCNILYDATVYSEALVKASADGDIEKINYMSTKLVPSTGDIKAAILAAIKCQSDQADRILVIKALLSLKRPLFLNEVQGFEPLVIASEKKYPEIVAILLQHARHGKPVVEKAFYAAIRRGSVACARLILESQGWVPAERLELCSRAILKYGTRIDEDLSAYLFDQGVCPNARDSQTGATMLYIAATRFYTSSVARNFMAHGASLDLDGGEYGTALHGAAVSGKWESVELLLSSGADVNAQNERVGTPLVAVMMQTWEDCSRMNGFKCYLNCHQCCARLLLDWGADVDAKCGEFGTALQAAQKVGNKLGIKMLLRDEQLGVNDTDIFAS
ncbi:uncharacterized protein N7500_010948 [Penicillium coprophilum]|uniref:uncharacterized protein n=1 Tax=Penicillium coprophilum TaxID=36646 RepID=UPI0023846A1E|nr:uncharacterized protein N7500_010948 [Penicillium coprophilum]KAJ5150759.1 hypothetical protein N7500_010948 [Penicillium coprophilum]